MKKFLFLPFLCAIIALCLFTVHENVDLPVVQYDEIQQNIDFSNIEYKGEIYEIVNNNKPFFEQSDIKPDAFENYSGLDGLGRCGTAYACIGIEIMPVEERGPIGMIKPSGWQLTKYEGIDGKYLFNRCHLIGYQLTGENANERNLITGTRYFNVNGMLPFENKAANYIRETKNHVLYRVTPVFENSNLVAKGVLMEALSVEDNGESLSFCVFVFNIQPGIEIDYSDGTSRLIEEKVLQADSNEDADYIINIKTGKFHYPDCPSIDDMKDKNKEYYSGNREQLIEKGYSPCGNCKP